MHEAFKERCSFAGTTMAGVLQSYIGIELETPVFTADPAKKVEKIPPAERMRMIAERDKDILKRAADCEPYRSIGASYGMTISGVSKVVSRNRKR